MLKWVWAITVGSVLSMTGIQVHAEQNGACDFSGKGCEVVGEAV